MPNKNEKIDNNETQNIHVPEWILKDNVKILEKYTNIDYSPEKADFESIIKANFDEKEAKKINSNSPFAT